jgi:hypothetical protein
MSEAAADIHIASRELRMKRDMLKSDVHSRSTNNVLSREFQVGG